MIHAKIDNPIAICIFENKVAIKVANNFFSLNKEMYFSGRHYGFCIISSKDGKECKKTYPTHNPIENVTMGLDGLQVKECFKNQNWHFDKNGRLLNVAFFNDKLKNELDFVAAQGGDPKEELGLSNECLGHMALKVKTYPCTFSKDMSL